MGIRDNIKNKIKNKNIKIIFDKLKKQSIKNDEVYYALIDYIKDTNIERERKNKNIIKEL